MFIKDSPIVASMCMLGIIVLIVIIVGIIIMSMNRQKKEGFRRFILRRIMAGNPSSFKTSKKCGRQFRGNEIGYLLNPEQIQKDWDLKPNEFKHEHIEATSKEITDEIADKTLQDITKQTGIDVRPSNENIEFDEGSSLLSI